MLLDLLFPSFCVGCGKVGRIICLSCIKKLPLIDKQTCVGCKKGSLLGLTHNTCKKKTEITASFSFYRYSPVFKKVLHLIKYKRALKGIEDILPSTQSSQLDMYFQLLKAKQFWLQPIPLFDLKRNIRGFNLPHLISIYFGNKYGLPQVRALRKIKDTPSQATIKDKDARGANLIDSFQIIQKSKEFVKNKNILLVDDVVTTGTTFKEAAYCFRENKAGLIYAFSLAKG